MKKAEIEKQAEKVGDKIVIYKAMQYRWKDTADPQIGDISYHLTEKEAIMAADALELSLDFTAVVDKVITSLEGFDSEIELSELDNDADRDTIYYGRHNKGEVLDPDAVCIIYVHNRYMNYSYSIVDIQPVFNTSLKTEADLVDASDSTSTRYCLVLSLEELKDEMDRKNIIPFNKLQSGSALVKSFLNSN